MKSMQLNLTNVIDTLKANVNPTRISRRKSKTAADYPALGDVKRFEKFPEIVDDAFISMYRDDLDEFLIPYIQVGEMTVSGAHRFIEGLIEQIFGNENHYGIFSYLKERNYENATERELVRTAERLINSGWRVLKDGKTNRYKIINSDKDTVIDATGSSEFYSESAAMVMDESAAHVFIDSDNASKIESLARAVSMDADELVDLGALDNLLYHTEDKMLSGQIVNYKKLKGVLLKQASYPVLTKTLTFSDLYQDGFTLSGKKFFSEGNTFIMNQGPEEFIVYPIQPELNQQYGFNKNMLSVIASKFKKELFNKMSLVTSQELTELSDLGRVIALMSNHWDNDKIYMSRFDMIDSLSRLQMYFDNGEISKDFYRKIFSGFASVVAVETILLGNKWFSLSGMSFDSISGKFYLYGNTDSFTTKIDELSTLYDSYDANSYTGEVSFEPFLSGIYPFSFDSELMAMIIENLPRDFFSSLAALEISIEGYPYEFSQVIDYMSKAKDFLMSRAK